MVWNLFSFKGAFSFGKSQTSQDVKSGLLGGWVTWVIWSFAKKLCMRCDAWAGILLWWSCQSPVAHSCSLLNPVNSFYGGMLTLNAKLDADSLLYLLSHLNAMATQCTCSLNSTYQPHWLIQWSHHYSRIQHMYSSPLSLAARLHQGHANCSHYINNSWTFPDRPWYILIHMYIFILMHNHS